MDTFFLLLLIAAVIYLTEQVHKIKKKVHKECNCARHIRSGSNQDREPSKDAD